MATSVTLNSVSYSIPAVGEGSWGTSVSNYLIALSTGVLSKAGGAFTLTADADFGANYGLKSIYYKSRGTTSTTGILRLANAETVAWRNAANSADLALTVNSSNVLTFNGAPVITLSLGSANTVLRMNSGGTAYEWAQVVDANVDASAAISGSKLQAASASNAGAVTTGSQTFAGVKTFSSNIRLAASSGGAGNATDPLVTPSDDTHTGIYFPGTNQIAISTNSTAALTISSVQVVTFSAAPTITPFGTAGIVHNNSSGVLSSSLVVNADVSNSAAIAYSKLNLSGSIVNADISGSAAIAYSKLNLSGSIVNADVSTSAAIALSKLATVTASRALASDASGYVSATSVTSTELGYVSGVTSAIQTQIDTKAPKASPTFSGNVLLQNAAGSQPELHFSEDPDNGTSVVKLKAPASLSGDVTFTLPDNDGSANQVLQTDGSGVLSWASPFTNPMTTTGDIVYSSDSSGTPARLAIGAATTVLVGGTTPAWSAISNTHVDAAAAIAGTKISPNFGSQNVSTTGSLAAGATTITANTSTTSPILDLVQSNGSTNHSILRFNPATGTGGAKILVGGSGGYSFRNSANSGDVFVANDNGQIGLTTTGWGTGGTAVGISAGFLTTSPSSARYKTDVVDLATEIDSSKVYDLREVVFTYTKDSRKSFGLIAIGRLIFG